MEKVKAFVTPKAVATWASVVEPNYTFDVGGMYSTLMSFDPEDESFIAMKAHLEDMLDRYFEETKLSLTPLKAKTVTKFPLFKEELDQNGDPTGLLTIRPKQHALDMDGKPRIIPIVDSVGRVIPNFSTLIGNGSNIKCKVYPKLYHSASSNVCGISLKLNAVQLIDLIEYKTSDFGDESGGFVAEASDVTEDF